MGKPERQAKIVYCYDRLWAHKLAQVYHLLVPAQEKYNLPDSFSPSLADTSDENSGHLYPSILQSTEGK
jgi:hypothetical protein